MVNGYRQDEEIANPEQCDKAVMRMEATDRLDKYGRAWAHGGRTLRQ
jgi:hypothetical protein